ncbi:antitoxin Xre/MbcA/ParS toxin-binding domain-containing protein [Pseudomonas sp. M47T1]|uniref:antitoxin Xre/MbcA/ParS toxin-binding domain-containing protein n=1 Tax=Pseudomonas sp. M47T1 TaxID=1179778 RepID=UPI003082A028
MTLPCQQSKTHAAFITNAAIKNPDTISCSLLGPALAGPSCKPEDRFSGKSPLSMLATTQGASKVEEMLIRLAEGFAF